MYERSYRVGGDLYHLQQEARRREQYGRVAVGQERDFADEYNTMRSVLKETPEVGWQQERRGDWQDAGFYNRGNAEEIFAKAPPVEHENETEKVHNRGLAFLDKLNLKTEDLILIGLIIFLIYCEADWDIIFIIGALLFVGWAK